ncbi:hypothetical protein [Roseateles sp. MS654]|uniref:hypothetical protein n=1 Tax=Roseateles sp. MS654 TaxID=3412685 RepID=UPI003C2C607F
MDNSIQIGSMHKHHLQQDDSTRVATRETHLPRAPGKTWHEKINEIDSMKPSASTPHGFSGSA